MFRHKMHNYLNVLLNRLKKIGVYVYRHSHNKTDFCMEELKRRKLIKVSGEGSFDFLQGLITNDMSNLTSSMYTMFLNNKGRILFDSIVYHFKEENTFLLECDSEVLNQLVKHLNIYKLRKKVDISSLATEFSVWCLYNLENIEAVDKNLYEESKLDVNNLRIGTLENKNIIVTPDPRTRLLGYRMVVKNGEEVPKLPIGNMYQICRYKLGIGEGVDEFLIGQSFPLEMNCDFLQGVSFNKGCYIGQELTARTFHTGVIRKRLMPLFFESEPVGIPMSTAIEDLTHTRKSPVGKVIAAKSVYGIGLMRVKETIESKSLKILHTTARSSVPVWWPDETVQQTYVKIKK